MPTHYDSDDDRHDTGSGDREISLGTGTVLGIFLALALVCSLFFGLGYSMGRKSAPGSAAGDTQHSSLNPFASSKSTAASHPAPAEDPEGTDAVQVAQPAVAVASGETAARATHERPATIKPSPTGIQPPAPETVSAAPAAGSATGSLAYVQVAAVSRKEDADLLMAALKRRGYTGVIRPQPQDKLLHIQVGPFPTKKDAEAMRQHLITDGYNPIIK